MGVAKLSSLRSKDPSTQVGCCIVNENKKIVAVGYNGMPIGCNDNDFPWSVKEGSLENTKYAYVVHAELNAILNSTQQLKGCTIYVSLFPCNECSKAIIQSGIKEIVYADDKYFGTPSFIASRRMLEASGVKVRQIKDIEVKVNEE
jgi:dCMP deaminase